MKSISLLLGGLFVLAGFNGASAHTNSDGGTAVELSEFRLDMGGTDTEEFVELTGFAGQDLSGLSFVILGDGSAGSGVVETAVDLTGFVIDANGYFVLAKSTFTLGVADLVDDSMSFENSDNVTYMLIDSFLGAVGDDLDTNDDGVLDALTGTITYSLSIIESVGTGDLVYGTHSIGPDGTPKAVGGESTGYFITNEAVHDPKAKHQTRMAAGRALTVHAMAAARGPGEHYTPVVMTQHTTHRCRVCSLDPNSNPIRRYDQMQSATVVEPRGRRALRALRPAWRRVGGTPFALKSEQSGKADVNVKDKNIRSVDGVVDVRVAPIQSAVVVRCRSPLQLVIRC